MEEDQSIIASSMCRQFRWESMWKNNQKNLGKIFHERSWSAWGGFENSERPWKEPLRMISSAWSDSRETEGLIGVITFPQPRECCARLPGGGIKPDSTAHLVNTTLNSSWIGLSNESVVEKHLQMYKFPQTACSQLCFPSDIIFDEFKWMPFYHP